MAYMQKYPTSTKAQELLASVADLATEAATADPERIGRGEDAFAWPPPSAATIGTLGHARR